jgi:hypothetical protein
MKNLVAIFAIAAVLSLPCYAKGINPDDLPDTTSTDVTVPSVTVNSIDRDALLEVNKKAAKKASKAQTAEKRHLLNVKLGFFGFHLM